MLAGYYTIASGMLSQQRDIDVIGNNLVNLQTPGFREDRLITTSFEQELATRIEANASATLGTGSPAAVVDEVIPMLHQGEFKPTGRTYDIAINGNGYFNIQADDGTVFLTRSGQFDVDTEGNLILPGKGKVMSADGQNLAVVGPNFRLEPTGEVTDKDGLELGKLMITAPPEGTRLVKQPNGMFLLAADAAGNPVVAEPVENCQTIQGTLELSNVDMTREMTKYMEVQRAFQTCSSALQIIDGMNRKSASQIGSIS